MKFVPEHLVRPAIVLICLFAVMAALRIPQALAAEEETEEAEEAGAAEEADEIFFFDFDKDLELKYRLAEDLTFGVELDNEFVYEGNFNLDDTDDEDLAQLTPELSVAFAYEPIPQLSAYLEILFERAVNFRSPGDEPDPDARLIIDQAYLNFRDIVEGVSLQVGRARIRDRREWLLDRELDGLRAFVKMEPFGLEVSATREELIDKDLLNDDSITDINNYLVTARYKPNNEIDTNAYVFYRDNRDDHADDLAFLGLQALTDWQEGGGLWLDTSYVFGRDEGNQVSGFAVDAGITLVPDTSWGFSATLGFAFGSGDDDPDDGKDHAFRQTGLQENNDGFNGITRFNYYGEVFDPELSNLIILTAGLGILPGEQTSLDLVYHRYWQPEKADFLRDSAIDVDPNGRSRHLGDEIDLVLGMSEFENFDVEGAIGAFFPGAAFPSDSDPAFVVRLEATIEF